MGLESEWRMDLRIGGTSAAPTVSGQAKVVRGTYSFAGKRFDIDSGTITFAGGPLADPQIAITASTTTNGITVSINITGSGQAPHIAFSSTPSLPQDEVLSRLLFGSSVTNLSATEAIQLAAALNSGKYISDDIYIEIITDARGFTATQLQVALTKSLSVLSQAGSFGGSNVSIKYSKDF